MRVPLYTFTRPTKHNNQNHTNNNNNKQALLFRNGERALGLPPDPQGFQTYLQRAEALGDPEALFCLADMHWHGP